MDPSRTELFRAFLHDCSTVYGIGDPGEDLESVELCDATLQTEAGQKKLAHMRFARELACWRALRESLGELPAGPVIAVEAGPCLSLLGWFLAQPPAPGQPIEALDRLAWQQLRQLPSWRALIAGLLGSAQRIALRGEPQWTAALLPDATVLLSFLFERLGTDEPAFLEDLRGALPKTRRILVCDTRHDRASELWRRVCAGLDIAYAPKLFRAEGLGDFSGAYPDKAAWSFRRTREHLGVCTALCGDAQGWRFLGE